jgi:hypothetical protein
MISLLLPRRLLILDTLRTYFLKAKFQQVELIQLGKEAFVELYSLALEDCLCISKWSWICTIFR